MIIFYLLIFKRNEIEIKMPKAKIERLEKEFGDAYLIIAL